MTRPFDRPAIARAAHGGGAAEALGALPEWDLTHLYPAMDSPAFAADVERAAMEARRFAEFYRGKLATLAAREDASAVLTEAVKAYEGLEDLVGKIMSYAGLVYSGDTTDPQRAKFYGDTQDKVTAISTELLFFGLELNRIDEGVLAGGRRRRRSATGSPGWKTSPRTSRTSSKTGSRSSSTRSRSPAMGRLEPALRRDDRLAALQGRRRRSDARTDAEPACRIRRWRRAQGGGRGRSAAVFRAASAHLRLITNTLAKDKEISDRWRGFEDVADSRHLWRTGSSARWWMRSSPRCARPIRACRTATTSLKARWFGQEAARLLGPQRATAPRRAAHHRLDGSARHGARAYGDFSPKMAEIAQRFFDESWIDAPARAGKAPGAFAHPTVPSAHPYVLLNYQGRPRDVMTLAHELGHGVHQVLAAPNGALMAPTPLTLAETASVFGEMLTFRKLLDGTSDPEAAQGDAGRQGRGHDQHGRAPDRVLFLRAQGP
jgi:oligoendopeptidase F